MPTFIHTTRPLGTSTKMRSATTLAALLLSLSMASCGDEGEKVPDNAVAVVQGTAITKAEFNRRLNPIIEQGEGVPGAKQLKLLRQNLVTGLIEAEWLEREAALEHVRVTDTEARQWYSEQDSSAARAERIGGDSAVYRLRLKAARNAQTARRSEARAFLLRRKLISLRLKTPTNADIRAYYAANKTKFVRPEQRRLRIVIAASRATAQNAVAALRNGSTWAQVSRAAPKPNQNVPPPPAKPVSVAEAALPADLGTAIFKAPFGKVSAPVKSGPNWHVFEVERTIPSAQVPLGRAREAVVSQLGSEAFNRAFTQLAATLRTKYRGDTQCAAEFVVPNCTDTD